MVLTGEIGFRTMDSLSQVFAESRSDVLRLDSGGGLIDSAARMGSFLQDNEIRTFVGATCASACVIVALSGKELLVTPERSSASTGEVRSPARGPSSASSSPGWRRRTSSPASAASACRKPFSSGPRSPPPTRCTTFRGWTCTRPAWRSTWSSEPARPAAPHRRLRPPPTCAPAPTPPLSPAPPAGGDHDPSRRLERVRPRAREPDRPRDLPRRHPRRHRRRPRTPTTASTPPPPPSTSPSTACPPTACKDTDVLLWWGHKAHGAVDDATADRVVQRVHEGMGLIVLHSGHFSKPFIRLMGTPCSLRWREAGERERLWAVNRSHPIIQRVGDRLELPQRGDVRRAVPRPRAAGDRADLLVRGRRGVPLRPHLPARRRPHLLLPPRPRDLPDLPRRRPSSRSCATPSTGPTTPPPPGTTSPRPRTSPSTAPRRRSPRRAPRCTSPARRATGERRHASAC